MFGFHFDDGQKRRIMSIILIILSSVFGLPAVDSIGLGLQRVAANLDNVART